MIIDNEAADLTFAKPPTVAELFDSFRQRLGNHEQPFVGLKLYFRLSRNGRYVGVTPSSPSSLDWDLYDHDGSIYFTRVARTSPPASPERPTVQPRQTDVTAVEHLAAKLAALSVESARACCCHLLIIFFFFAFNSHQQPQNIST